jgi:hypothetical protein
MIYTTREPHVMLDEHYHKEKELMLRTRRMAAAGVVAALALLGTSTAYASVAPGGIKAVPGIQLSSITCTARTCVAVGTDPSGSDGKTALINPATGSVKLGAGVLKNLPFATGPNFVACPTAMTCLSLPVFHDVASINTKTGLLNRTGKVASSYDLANIACAGSKFCYATGSYSPPNFMASSQGYLAKISPAGKILSGTVNKKYIGYSGISCESSSLCLMTGWPVKGPWQAIPLLNGKSGTPRNLPAGFEPQELSCYSNKLCYAIGAVGFGSSSLPELVPLNPKTGAAGRVIKLKLTGAPGLACYSGAQCVVAGDIVVGTGNAARAEAAYVVITKGKAGSLVVSSTRTGSGFGSVACAAATECYAVGTYPVPIGTGSQVSFIGKV